MSYDGFYTYLTQPAWLASWGAGTDDDWNVPYTMRAQAAGTTLWYGIFANPAFWAGAATFGVLMTSLSGYPLYYSVAYYIWATAAARRQLSQKSYVGLPAHEIKYYTGL